MIKRLVIVAVVAAVLYGQSARAASVMEPKTLQEYNSLASSGTVAVFLGTMSCPHCRAFLPKFREVAAANNNVKFVFAELNGPLADLSHTYRTQNPTLVVLKNGTEVNRVTSDKLNKQSAQAAIK